MLLPAFSHEVASMPEHWVRVRRLDTLEDRSIVPVVVEGTHLLLVRDGPRVYATERACPHEGADLAAGRYAHGKLFCPRHLAWFDLKNGRVGGGWDFRPLRTYRTTIIDEVIYADMHYLRPDS
jgi:3-phenylpropionate/trans-cinnamate dioxygenase ferredoxin subunit